MVKRVDQYPMAKNRTRHNLSSICYQRSLLYSLQDTYPMSFISKNPTVDTTY